MSDILPRSEVFTRFHFDSDGDHFTAERVQDIEDIVEGNKNLQKEPQSRKADWRSKWRLPNVMVERFYNEYCGGGDCPPRPMNQEFWLFVDKRLNDPDFAVFRTDNKSNPFFIGYGK